MPCAMAAPGGSCGRSCRPRLLGGGHRGRRQRRIMTTMPTPAKRKSSVPDQRPPGSPAASPAPPSGPFLRYCHSAALRKKTLAVLGGLEQAQDATVHRDALAELVVELTNGGMDYFFMKPLKVAKAGFIVEQSAQLGLMGVQQVMASVIRNIIGRMGPPQLLSVCGSIRRLML